jgi:hypothetical protein
LEGRSYTYKDTQLLRYNDPNRSSPVSEDTVSSERIAHTGSSGQRLRRSRTGVFC